MEIYDDGYKTGKIASIDISESCTEIMKKRWGLKYPFIECIWIETWKKGYTMDAKKMNFEKETFNCVIDKGAIDSYVVFFNITFESQKKSQNRQK